MSAIPPRNVAQGLPCFALVVAGLMAVIPFLYPLHPAPRTSFYSEWLAVAFGTSALLGVLSARFWTSPRIPLVDVYLVGFIGLIALQALFVRAPYAQAVLAPGLLLLWAALLAALGHWVQAQLGLERAVSIFAWLVLVGGLLNAATGLIQYLDGPGPLAQFVSLNLHPGSVYGNIAQRNQLAGQLTLALIAAAYLFARSRLSLPSALLFTGLLSFVAALTTSRSVFLYAICILTVVAVARKKNRGEPWIRMAGIGLAFAVVVLLLQPALPQLGAWLRIDAPPLATPSFTALARMSDPSGVALRLLEWDKAAQMFLGHPLLGVGLGNYSWHSFLYRASVPEFAPLNTEWFGHAHNLFLQVAAETGAVGLLVLLGLMLTWVRQFWRQSWSLEHGFGAAFLGVVFINSNLEFPLWHAYFLGPTALMLGLFDSRSVVLRIDPRLGRAALAACLSLAAVVLVVTVQGYGMLTRTIYTDLATPERAGLIVKARMNPLLRPYAELVLTVAMPLNRDNIEQKLQVSARVFRTFPDARRAYQHVSLLALAGREEEARNLLRMAISAYPEGLERFMEEAEKLPDPRLSRLLEVSKNLTAERDRGARANLAAGD